MYYLSNGVKVKCGYTNAALYNFHTGKVYLVANTIGQLIIKNQLSALPQELVDELYSEGFLTKNRADAEPSPVEVEYDLFDDKYSYRKCKLAYLEITDVCNNHCIHCYAGATRNSTGFMSLNSARNYIDQFKSLGDCDFRITGGEPFLHKDVCSIASYIHQNISPLRSHSIVSNGSFDINDAFRILEMGFELQISIYGVTEEKFCSFTNSSPAEYRKVIDNLEALSKSAYRKQIVLLFSVNAITYGDIETFKVLADAYGFRYILNRPAKVGRTVTNHELLELSPEQYAVFARSQRNPNKSFCYHLCQLFWVSIMVNGDVTPCGFFRTSEYIMGNLNNSHISEIWHTEKYEKFRSYSADNVKYCNNCEFKYLCTAGCCGETAAYTGDIFNPYVGCQIKPYENPDYLKVQENELYLVIKNAAGIFDFEKRGNCIC